MTGVPKKYLIATLAVFAITAISLMGSNPAVAQGKGAPTRRNRRS